MADQPSGRPRWIIIIAVTVLLCLAACGIGGILTLVSPAINATRLPAYCVQQNPDLSSAECSAWVERITTSPEYTECFQAGMSSGQPSTENLYACLVDRGVGPD